MMVLYAAAFTLVHWLVIPSMQFPRTALIKMDVVLFN